MIVLFFVDAAEREFEFDFDLFALLPFGSIVNSAAILRMMLSSPT